MMKLLDIPFLPELAAIRHKIHQNPELAYHEVMTSDLVAHELASYGLTVHRGLAKTGVVASVRKGAGQRAIGLRADMDALPLEEKNDFSHRSCVPGRMHACGHDGHTTMLLGAARYVAEHLETLPFEGTVYFVFQPAEEAEGGARVMIEDGLFDEFPMDAVFGLHNWPGIPVGEMAVHDGPVMAGTCAFEITVAGKGGHAAMPHLGVDTMLVAAHLVTALQSVVSRNVHPCDSAVVSVTQIHGGDAVNVVPDDAVLKGTIRSFNTTVQELVEKAMERICQGIGQTFGAQITVRFERRYPPTVNSPQEALLCAKAAADVVGDAAVHRHDLPSMGAEDFAYMLQKVPGCYVWLGNGATSDADNGGHGACSLHNPYYDFNHQAMPYGISYWIQVILQNLGTIASGDKS